MNAIEILNKELAGKSLVMYAPEINGEVIESLKSFTDFTDRGFKSFRRYFVINSIEDSTPKDRAYQNSHFIIVLGNGERIPMFSFTKFEILQNE